MCSNCGDGKLELIDMIAKSPVFPVTIFRVTM